MVAAVTHEEEVKRSSSKDSNGAEPLAKKLKADAAPVAEEEAKFEEEEEAKLRELVQYFTESNDLVKDVQAELVKVDDVISKEMRLIENKCYEMKKEFFQKRSKILAEKSPKFWSTLFLNHPMIECFLNTSGKNENISSIDIAIIESLEDVKIAIQNTEEKYCVTLSLYFGENPYFENKCVERKITFSDDNAASADGETAAEEALVDSMLMKADVEASELKMKSKLKTVVDQANKPHKSKSGVADIPQFAQLIDAFKTPFIVQFVDTKNHLMNSLVDKIKQVYNDPVADYHQALNDLSNDMEDNEDSDFGEEEELKSIEEEDEENNEWRERERDFYSSCTYDHSFISP